MTPRALLTTIGAAAIGFAIAIGGAAGFAAGDATAPATANLPASGATAERASGRADDSAPGTNLAELMTVRTAKWAAVDRDCVAV